MKNKLTQRILFLVIVLALVWPLAAFTSLAAPAASAPQAVATALTCQTFQPADQDAYISSEKVNENKGNDNELRVKTEALNKLQRSLLQFEVTGLPSGALIDSATLSLWVKDVRDGNVTINARPATTAWAESTVTWANFGSSYGAIMDSEAFVKGVKNYWADWDVSSAAAAWISNPAANFGVVLESPVTVPKSEVKFKSSEDGTASQRPKLTICWGEGLSIGPDRMAEGYPGQTTTFAHPLRVGALKNEIVHLSALSSQGWAVRFYYDANGNGVRDAGESQISQTPAIGPNAIYNIAVEVDVPAAAVNGVRDDITLTASGQNSGLIDTAIDRIQIGYPPLPDPVLDGKKDAVYAMGNNVDYCDASGNNLARLMSTIDLANPDYVWVILEMDRRHVDNTYGDNVHPSWGGSQSLGALDGSDAGQVILRNGAGTVIYDVTADYFETNILGSAGINAAEGSYNVLPNDDLTLVDVETSIGYSLQTYCTAPGSCTVGGLDLLQDSPPIDINYVPTDATFSDWQFSYLYEFRFDSAAFGPSGFGDVSIDYVHVSPNKTGSNVIIVEPCDGSIGDRVWRDNDQDGNQDAGEAGLNGVQVSLYRDNGDGVLDPLGDDLVGNKFTSGDGNYDFANLGANVYWVDVVDSTVPAGHLLTTANDPLEVTLGQAEDYNDADFGYASLPEIAISKTLASEEPLYAGNEIVFSIQITNMGQSVIGVLPLQDIYDPAALAYLDATPASNDNVNDGVIDWSDLTTYFGDLAAGQSVTVSVRFLALTQTLASSLAAQQAGVSSASPITALGQGQNFNLAQFNLAVDNAAPDVAACTAPFNNSVYTTTSNCKCVKPTEMTVRYLGPGPTTITIGGNGVGGPFTNINTGDTFTIAVTGNEPTFTATGQPAQAIHTSCSAPLYPGWTSRPAGQDKTTQGGPFEVVSFSTNGVPFVLANPSACILGSIGDRVIVGAIVPDTGSEPGVSSVTVNLYGGNCPSDSSKLTAASRLKTTTTNVNGFYTFSGLMPGEYCAAVDNGTLPILYTLSTASPLDAASNSNTVTSCDFGVELVGANSIGDRVFYDLNGDGLPDDDGDPGLNGVVVNLYQGACPASGSVFQTATTSGNGSYDFTTLPDGDYCVDVDESTLPAAVSLTTANEPLSVLGLGPDQDYNDADFGYRAQSSGETCDLAIAGGVLDIHGVSAAPVQDEECVTILASGSIGDYVWNDANGNGLQDADEDNNGIADADEGRNFGLDDAVVNLYREGGNGVCDAADLVPANFVASQITVGGAYKFEQLPPDVYCVDVDDSSLAGYEFIPGPESGPKPHLVDLDPQEEYTAADFGYVGRGAISGVVFYDWDEDGHQGIGEPGIPNIELCLYKDSDGDGLLDPGSSPLACQPTGSSGDYLFLDHLPGAYLLVQTQPAGLESTTPNTLAVTLVVVGSSGSAPNNDFGEIVYSSIGDFIFRDPNGDGVQDPGENDGVPGVPITVKNLATLEVVTVVSDSSGFYLVDNLLPGTYEVEVPALWPGLVRTTAAPTTVVLGIADHPRDVDFGYIAPTAVQLTSFAAEYTANGVLVRWATSFEEDQTGFRIWRSASADGVYKLVSPVVKAANNPLGSSYEWLDTNAFAGQTYWYRIESLPDGQMFGPLRVMPDPGATGNRVFIPIVVR